MTRLYREVPITSAEQAEALPVGTVARRTLKFESTWDTIEQPEVAVKVGRNAWIATAADEDAWDWLDRHLVDWTALVPIEAEEVYGAEMKWTTERTMTSPARDKANAEWQRDHNPELATGRIRRQYRTPWEDA